MENAGQNAGVDQFILMRQYCSRYLPALKNGNWSSNGKAKP